MELYVSDTVLTIPAGRGRCTSPTRREKMRRERPSGHNGECKVTVVSQRRMEELWK